MVLAGQQPGFLGGPLYNLWKALHVIRLAREASAAWGVPVVPAFWNHADDHDVAEVHHAWVQNRHLDLQKVALGELDSGRRPLGTIVFEEERHRLPAIRELLAELLGGGERAEAALERFMPRAGETFASSFSRLFLDLFGSSGLLMIEPDSLRPSLSRALARIVGVGPRPLLEEGAALLLAAGHTPAIDPAQAALVFRLVQGRRQALRFAEEGFRYDDEPGSRTPAELAAEIVQEPADWSAGALLRPIVQDLALPVAAYVGGWGELAYHAELPLLRRAAGAPVTPFVPRLAATLVEPTVGGSLATLGLTVGDALAAHGVPEPEGGREPSPLSSHLRAQARRAREGLAGLEDEVAALDPGLVNQVRRTARDMEKLVERLAQKVERVHANAKGHGRRHVRRVENALVPRGEPQERVRGALEIVARHGTEWLSVLLEEIEPFPLEHLVVTFPPDPEPGESPR